MFTRVCIQHSLEQLSVQDLWHQLADEDVLTWLENKVSLFTTLLRHDFQHRQKLLSNEALCSSVFEFTIYEFHCVNVFVCKGVHSIFGRSLYPVKTQPRENIPILINY